MSPRRAERKIDSGFAAVAMRMILRMASMHMAPKRNPIKNLSVRRFPNFIRGIFMFGALALTGCTASIQGAPERLYSVSSEADLVKDLTGSEWNAEYARSRGQRRRELRDQITLARMYAIDIYYSEYEGQLTRERQDVGFFSTIANLALTSSATLVGAKESKTILAAAATGLTGVKAAYDKEILIEKTITILQQQMRTRRKEVKIRILDRLSLDTGSYPLELALIDLEAYYRAGTITGALVDVSEATGARLAQVSAIEEQVVVTKFRPVTDLGTRIRAFVRINPQNLEATTNYLAQNHGGLPFALFVRNASRSDQLKMIQALNIP